MKTAEELKEIRYDLLDKHEENNHQAMIEYASISSLEKDKRIAKLETTLLEVHLMEKQIATALGHDYESSEMGLLIVSALSERSENENS